MQIKQGLPAGSPCFFDLPALLLLPSRERGVGWTSGKLGVVLYSPQTLVPSSRGTTSLGSDGLTARRFLKSDA